MPKIVANRIGTGTLSRLGDLLRDRKGVGAVEFALIAPLLLCLYITAFELTIGLSISKRTTRTASTIADLVTQQTAVTPTWLATMKDVTASLFAPYTPQSLSIKVTGVTIDASGNPTVAWSWDQSNARPYAVGSAVNVPTDMRSPSTFVVRAEVSVNHTLLMVMPGLLPSKLQTVTISRQYFYRQRVGSTITCSGC
jgi:Flp pilus assembly protein TadG